MILTFWHRLDRLMAKLRPHREPLVLLVDALMVVLAWTITYLFRVGLTAGSAHGPAKTLG